MKKQGFTLIELMVVIVIMGILAAVAVPKLFGMIAKSKASEVGPAAGTYVKLQDAYVSEANKVGSWTKIGYIAPGGTSAGASSTTNFAYRPGSADDTEIGSYSAAKEWGAYNKVALNSCAIQTAGDAATGANWTIQVDPSTNGNSVTYTAKTNCEELTPSFAKITTTK